MALIILLRHVILTFVSCSMTSHAMVSRTFKLKVNSTGSRVCAVDEPSTVIPMVVGAMTIPCGGKCNVDPFCQLFQAKEDLAQCELFKFAPSNFSPNDRCTSYAATQPVIQSGILVTSWSGTTQVMATAILNGQLFATRVNVAQVSVYDTTSFQLLRQITFTGLGTWLYGLATSAINNYLYISDYFNNHVHRVDLSITSTVSVVTWSEPGTPLGLSVTNVGNVLVATNSDKSMKEYTPTGSLVRVITSNNSLWHAVEVNKDIWAFTVRGSMNGICTTLTNGTLIKCYGSTAGSAITQMNIPGHLAVGPRGNILVADSNNNRILVVDPSFAKARQLPLPFNTNLTYPYALSSEESRGRLYIGEYGGQNRVLVFDGIW